MLPRRLDKLIRKSKKPLKYVLLRLPKDFSLTQELQGVEIDLTDLHVTSHGTLSAIPDLQTNPERASVCPLLPTENDELQCGPAISAHIQIVRKPASTAAKIKKELVEKPHAKVKSELKASRK